jgi:elongation factor Ts
VARTDEFMGMCQAFAGAVASDPANATVEGLLESTLDGEKVADKVTGAISRLGENVVVKRARRLASDGPGVAGGYVHAGGKLGVVVTLATEAQGPEVESVAKDLAMHVAAADPTPVAIDRAGVDPALLESERSLFKTQALQSGKPEKVIDKIIEGRVNKFLAEVCLLEQAFVKDPDCSIGDLLKDAGAAAGADIRVCAYERFKLGEGDSGEA